MTRRITPNITPALCDALESRTLLSVARPSYNTGTGFFAAGGHVYDANGERFKMRGMAMTHAWGDAARNNATIPQLKKTGANAVRVVFGGNFGTSDSAAYRQQVVANYVNNGLVAVVEDHDATGNTDVTDGSTLQPLVNQWVEPANVAWLRQYERQVILNIANEWGPNSPVYRDAYVSAVAQLRAAGIKNMIMIDAGGYGQEIATIDNYAQAIFNSDPQKNIVFSVHTYGLWYTGAPTGYAKYNVATKLASSQASLRAFGAPLVIGEFTSSSFENTAYDARTLMLTAQALDLGWLGWAWNQNNPTSLNLAVDWQYNSDADLTSWGKLLVTDPVVGLKATAQPATVFASTPALAIQQTNTAPRVDAAVDPLWEGVPSRAVANALQGAPGASDASATFKVLWDADRLYVLASVVDDVLRNDSGGPEQDDSVELFVDGGPSRGGRYDGANDAQLIFGFGDAAVARGANGALATVNGVLMSTAVTATGYLLEASIPWSSLGVAAALATRLGFDVHVNDDDDGGNRDAKLAFHAKSDQTWVTPELFGVAALAADATAPRLVSSVFDHAAATDRLVFAFSENVAASLTNADVTLESLTTPGVTLTLSATPAYDAATNTAAFTFAPGTVPDGRYRATLVAGGVRDPANNALVAAASLSFFSLAGDVDRDGAVGFTDLVALAQNYGRTSGATYAGGDLDGDGRVSFEDLVILAQQYGASVPIATTTTNLTSVAPATSAVRRSRVAREPARA